MKKIIYPLVAFMLPLGFTGCGDDEPKHKEEQIPAKTVIVYAVASNNLYRNLVANKQDMLKGLVASGDDCRLLLYEVNNQSSTKSEANLYSAQKNEAGEYEFVSVKKYDRGEFSTDPIRIKEVLNDAVNYEKSESYDLFFWSHGTGWTPSDNINHEPTLYSFGMDTSGNITDEINIDELAAAIPSGIFNTIWFDACYMSSVETIYELSDKCDYFVGYPTEIWSAGSPYDKILPVLYKPEHNLTEAATTVFDMYNNINRAVTVAVYDMSKMESLAMASSRIYAGSETPTLLTGMTDYSRKPYGPFYDFGQYTRAVALANGRDNFLPDFEKALSDVTIYKAASARDFNNREILPENYSGMSCFPYSDDNSDKSKFYQRLKWYQAVFK